MSAGVYSATNIGELHQVVYNLSGEGYRIVTVLHVGDYYHVVAQKDHVVEVLEQNINLKADFIEKTIDQLAAMEAKLNDGAGKIHD